MIELKKSFLDYLRFEKRYSFHTLKAYENDIEQFVLFMNERNHSLIAEEISYKDIRNWLVYLVNNGVSARSVNRKISTLKSIYKFAIKNGKLQQNPTDRVIAPKSGKKLPSFIEEKHFHILLDQIFQTTTFTDLRDKTIIEMFYNTGIRLSELITLVHEHVNLSQQTIKVLGKQNKERIIPLSSPFANVLSSYIQRKEEEFPGNGKGYFFVTNKGDKLYPKFVYRMVNKYLSQVSTLEKRSPHVIRHSFATHMLNHGADLNAIKELLGHANLSATQIYTYNTFEKLKEVYKQAHPRA